MIKGERMNFGIEKKIVDWNYRNYYMLYTKNWQFGITMPYRGEMNKWYINWRKVKPRMTSTVEYGINPYYIWKRNLKWKLQLWKLKHNKEEYKICGGCGGGVSEYKIRDPNHGHGNEWFNCCDHCVNFYDARWSSFKIIKWKNKKSIGKKF